jgi:hypothetical protein
MGDGSAKGIDPSGGIRFSRPGSPRELMWLMGAPKLRIQRRFEMPLLVVVPVLLLGAGAALFYSLAPHKSQSRRKGS